MITQSYLQQILNYDAKAGIFTWKINKGRLCKVGNVAGSTDSWGHRQICIDGKKILAHRLAWIYVYGELPKYQIDHIDGNKQNNSIQNLRDVNQFINQQNRNKARIDNSSGFMGVKKSGKKYIATIKANKQRFYLGTFDAAEKAFEAYKTAKEKLHGVKI
jgi:hypothetical protein